MSLDCLSGRWDAAPYACLILHNSPCTLKDWAGALIVCLHPIFRDTWSDNRPFHWEALWSLGWKTCTVFRETIQSHGSSMAVISMSWMHFDTDIPKQQTTKSSTSWKTTKHRINLIFPEGVASSLAWLCEWSAYCRYLLIPLRRICGPCSALLVSQLLCPMLD